MHRFRDRLTQVQTRIHQAAALSGRNAEEITLLAVSKKHTAEAIREAVAEGLVDFGENYLQEAIEKQSALADLKLNWHYIGPIQSNKTRQIADHFDWVHSVDRLKIAQRLSEQRAKNKNDLNICIQVNIDKEESKSGIAEEEIFDLTQEIIKLPKLHLRGLMIIPNSANNDQQMREVFRHTRELKNNLSQKLNLDLDTLSMGMSRDLDSAIAEGATIVRIGTALFGQRTS